MAVIAGTGINLEKYSVLMSVYKKENPLYLDESISSILSQTAPTNDFVLVCDGPLTAELNSVIDKYTNEYPELFQIVRLEKNVGLGNALNKGIKYCKNELVARMDSDDIAMPERCISEIRCFEEDEQLDIVSGTVLEFSGSTDNIISKKSLPETNDEIRRYARRRCPFNHPFVMYKKTAVQDAGGYLDFPLFEDYYLWVRMLKCGAKAYNIKEPLGFMRSGEDMYKRRGGFGYLKKAVKFRTYMFKNHYCGFADYAVSLGGQILVCLMPVRLRMKLYTKMLRNGER